MDRIHTDGFIEDAELLAEAVVDTIHESLLVLDADLRIKMANRRFYSEFRVRSNETRDTLIYELGNGQWNIPELKRLLEDILPHDSHFEGFEVSHEFPQIGKKVMLLNARKLERRRGQQPFILLAIQDISERKQAEDAVRRSNGELSRFAYVLSHDLQAPLRTVKVFTQLLAKKHGEKFDAEAKQLARLVEQGTENMENLIRALLSYATAMEAEPGGKTQVSLDTVFNQAVANLRALVETEAAEISSDPLPTVNAYPTQILQLFQNLVSNALKYRKPSVTPDVHVSAQGAEQFWIVSVKDNGVGIAPEYQQKIFRPMTRLHGGNIPGVGIGLATCQKVVEHHGGRIWVESGLDAGSTFYFTLQK